MNFAACSFDLTVGQFLLLALCVLALIFVARYIFVALAAVVIIAAFVLLCFLAWIAYGVIRLWAWAADKLDVK